MNETPAPSYSIDELAALAELPRRTVRYYIQQGLVDRPIATPTPPNRTPRKFINPDQATATIGLRALVYMTVATAFAVS